MNNPPCSARIWVLSELYYPEDGATGHLLTQIAESLAEDTEVRVLCAQPHYTQRREMAPRKEVHNGVDIRRCWSTSFSKDRIVLRMINMMTILMTFSWNMLWRFRKGDQVLVVTNPPALPFVAWIICRLRGAQCHLLIHDIYPDVLVPTRFTRENSLLYRLIDTAVCRLYRGVDQIITIGRDMQRRVVAKSPELAAKTVVIPNWCDAELLTPVRDNENPIRARLGLNDKFVVLYSGNIGRTHGLSTIAEAARILEGQHDGQIHWLICGNGGGKQAFVNRCNELGLRSVSIHPFFPREELIYSLNCGDVGIICFVSGMSGISVPSRMYNFFAAGCPVVGVTEPDSELAMVLSEHDLGWIVPTEQPQLLADQISQVYHHRKDLEAMSSHCRTTAAISFTRDQSMSKFREVLVKSVC